MLGCEQNERQGSEIFITSLYIDLILQCAGVLWKRYAPHYTSTGLGIIPKKTFFFCASLIILEIACNIFATFYPECLSRYLNPIHTFGAKMLVWEKESKSLFENEVRKPKNTHSNASVLDMTNIKISFHKKIFEWIGSI